MYNDYCEVRCKFWFYNSGNNDTVQIGFPCEIYDKESPGTFAIEDFFSIVNKKPIDTKEYITFHIDTIQMENHSIIKDGIEYYVENSDSLPPILVLDTTSYTKWFVKDVVFKANDTTFIEDSYTCQWSGSVGGSFLDKTFEYFIGTGATWHKGIGKGTIVFDYSEYCTDEFIGGLLLDSDKFTVKTINGYTIINYNNYLPKNNETVGMYFYDYPNASFDLSGYSANVAFKSFVNTNSISKNQMQMMKDEILAHVGFIFKNQQTQAYFEKMKWYKKNSDFNLKGFDNQFYKLLDKNCKLTETQIIELYNNQIVELQKQKDIEDKVNQYSKEFEIDKITK